ncbi:MAG: acylneuraminate cytidylyltransferase family protein [Verrucomicrobiota bacterium]
MSTVALLPMKAHSERVRGKNFRPFAGKPLFRWILDTLLSIEEIDKIVINTDARTVLFSHALEESGRIEIRDRKEELCGDMMSMNRVIEDDIDAVEADTYIMTHTTNPLLSADTIRAALAAYKKGLGNGKDSLFSVNRMQTRFYREDGSPVNHDPENLVRTQDLENWFEENSCLYLFSRDSFASTDARIGEAPILFETPRLESADIDDETGWHAAEIIALSRLISESHSQHAV